jgi:dolichol-phosphate mannosyltransferase
MKVVIVIPTYNERGNTERMIKALSKVFPQITAFKMHVLYVDANSPDGTAEIIRTYQAKYPWLHLLVEEKKEGMGKAYAKGMTYAMKVLKADYLVEFDGDFQHRPTDIPRLMEKISQGYDYVIGSRYIHGGSIPAEWGFDRKFLSVVGNLVARVMLLLPSIHDVTGGFRVSKVKGFMDNFDFDTLLSRRFAYKVHLLSIWFNQVPNTLKSPSNSNIALQVIQK